MVIAPGEAFSGKAKTNRIWLTLFLGMLLSLACGAIYLVWIYAREQEALFRIAFSGKPLPALTSIFLSHSESFISFLIPWCLYAIGIVIRGVIHPRELVAFASTLSLVLLTGVIVFAMGMHLPWVPYSMNSGMSRRMDMERLVQTFHAADRGEAEAYLRLHYHYAHTTQKDLADYYLRRAVDLDHSRAAEVLQKRDEAALRLKILQRGLKQRPRPDEVE